MCMFCHKEDPSKPQEDAEADITVYCNLYPAGTFSGKVQELDGFMPYPIPKIHICPNHAVRLSTDGLHGVSWLPLDTEKVNEFIVKDASGYYSLKDEVELNEFFCTSLSPLRFPEVCEQSKVMDGIEPTSKFWLHDDFYDECGFALQPVDEDYYRKVFKADLASAKLSSNRLKREIETATAEKGRLDKLLTNGKQFEKYVLESDN